MFVPSFLATTFSTQVLQTSTPTSFYVISIINAAQFLGRITPAWASDFKHPYFGPEAWQFISYLALGILGFWWAKVHNLGGYIPWLIVYGFFSGFALTLPAIVLPYICPNLAVYGTRIGTLYAVAGVGFLISTPVASAANAATGSFLGGQVWTGLLVWLLVCCFLGRLWRPGRGGCCMRWGREIGGREGGELRFLMLRRSDRSLVQTSIDVQMRPARLAVISGTKELMSPHQYASFSPSLVMYSVRSIVWVGRLKYCAISAAP